MFAFARTKSTRRAGSSLALAIALISGTALTAVVMEAPAHAKKKKEKEQKADYSKEFVAAYTPVNELTKAEPMDESAVRAGLQTVTANASTPDDNLAAGGMLFNVGVKLSDMKMQRQGMDMMIASGRVAPEKQAQYIFNAGQLAYNDDDYATARARFEEAAAAGYAGVEIEPLIAESYFREDRNAEGLEYLRNAASAVVASGNLPQEDWLKRGIAIAYNNDIGVEALKFSTMYAKYYPSQTSWGDALAIQRTFVDYDEASILDIMRLATRTDSMRSGRDYADYIEAADARRLPGEVKRVVDAGIASGAFEASDPFVQEAKTISSQRIAADKAELPVLERDARAAGSTAVTATAAGDVMLSYGLASKAEDMYTIALTKNGVDQGRVLTRLGIAQIDQGKADAALETFGKVGGKRKLIGELWSIYAEQKKASAAPADNTAADVEVAGE